MHPAALSAVRLAGARMGRTLIGVPASSRCGHVALVHSTVISASTAASSSTPTPLRTPKAKPDKSKKGGSGTKAKQQQKQQKVKMQLGKPRVDYNRLLADQAATEANIRARAFPLAEDHVLKLATARATALRLEQELNNARAEHGRASDAFRDTKNKEDKKVAVEAARALKDNVSKLEAEFDVAEATVLELALTLPNFSHPLAPVGPEENAVTVETFGPDLLPASELRDHVDIAEKFGWLDNGASAIATGSSWPYLVGVVAQLEHALVGYALSTAVRHGYTPVSPPDVVSTDVAWRCGFQPRDGADGPRQTYFLEGEEGEPKRCLAGTAEIPLAALWANRTLSRDALPARVVGVGRAFRAEAGARGADTRGLYRVHQFTKVELFTVTAHEDSEGVMEEIRNLQKEIATGLGLSVRVLDMPTEELGASASRKYDMEAWMPGRGKWGEITSTSNCTDYQARRLHIRYRTSDEPGAPMAFAHTLNGTAAAVPRLIVALLENGARIENDQVVGVDLPKVLRPWWVGPEATGEQGIVRFV